MYSTDRAKTELEPQQKPQEFPIVCETCFGDSPYMTMTKAELDKECKICTKPYTVFRWKAGKDARFKKTEICKTCSLVKNVCQVCIHDLEFGLPVQLRDAALAVNDAEKAAVSDVNRAYQSKVNEQMIERGEVDQYDNFQPNEIVSRLARSTPYYRRNASHICSFFLRGECNRGVACPYRHEKPLENDYGNQNIQDRYHGTNDPVAQSMLNNSIPRPPPDQTITTLYLGNVDTDFVSESDLRSTFFPFGDIKFVKMITDQKCAFICFDKRDAAESAVQQLFNKLSFGDLAIKISWARSAQPNNNRKQFFKSKTNLKSNVDKDHGNDDENNQDNNNGNNEDDEDEDIELPFMKSLKPAPSLPIKPTTIKTLPSFKINPTPQSSSTDTNKPYYSAMDPNTYGGRI